MKIKKGETYSEILWMSNLDLEKKPEDNKKTGVVCTISSKNNSIEFLKSLQSNGMNVVRMNFSHGSHEEHSVTIENTKQAFSKNRRPVAIALDTKGPEIRIGEIQDPNGITIQKDKIVELTTDISYSTNSTQEKIYVDYKKLPNTVKTKSLIYIDDGALSLEVISISGDSIKTKAINSHILKSRKGVNIPYAKIDLPALSEKDKADIKFGIAKEVDFIFASFIRKASDVHEIRNVIGSAEFNIQIISKIESHEGLENFQEILEASDGIMIARGDLGIEIPPEKVFAAQKKIAALCNRAGKPVICATQMLESMIHNPRPTRAEVSDVGNAVLDGVDCVMLSGETASGKYPKESVGMIAKVCKEAELIVQHDVLFPRLVRHSIEMGGMYDTFAQAVVGASLNDSTKLIVVLTSSGKTASLIAKYRPPIPIIAITRSESTANHLLLHRGCIPIIYRRPKTKQSWEEEIEERLKWATEYSKEHNLIKSSEHLIFVQGYASGGGNTNTFRIIKAD
eukprot:GHVP01037669.1.p1 GENE.GHVP01037669.1~~GHVP01037669.1.p1  ORF type:complete len:510 (-),score=89.15 GHVP01037669.1:300-1829(-)